MMYVLDQIQLQRVSQHKYSLCGLSIVDRWFLNPVCRYLVQLLPKWLAPNVLTICGGLLLLIPGVIFIMTAPAASCQQEVHVHEHALWYGHLIGKSK